MKSLFLFVDVVYLSCIDKRLGVDLDCTVEDHSCYLLPLPQAIEGICQSVTGDLF